jgi:hypothetical protein
VSSRSPSICVNRQSDVKHKTVSSTACSLPCPDRINAGARTPPTISPRFGGARVVGGFWTKDNQVEIDLVGANRHDPGVELQVAFIGTIKWRAHKPLDGHDMSALESATARMAGANPSTPVAAVSRQGFDQIARPFAAVPAEDIIAAFPAD